MGGYRLRVATKRALARARSRRPARGITILIYHRVAGRSPDELDLDPATFAEQVEALSAADVISLDDAVQRLESGDATPGTVLTFDDGFADVYDNAWPLLRERALPFTLFLATRYVGGRMRWDGATGTSDGSGLSWEQISEFVESGLCTLGNHTHSHARPSELSVAELDACGDAVEARLGVRPQHFAYPWGVPVPHLEPELRRRFRTASTGYVGRNLPGRDLMRLRRVPVRQSDPLSFFAAKLTGQLIPERTYGALVATAKKAGAHA